MADLDAVRALLPVWARAPGLGLGPAAFAIGFAVTALAARIALPPLRRLDSAHWTERARATQPARWVAAVVSCSAAATLAGIAAHRAGGLLGAPVWGVALWTGLAAYLGATCAAVRLERKAGIPTGPLTRSVLGRLAALLVFAPHLLVVATLACVVDGTPGAKNAVAAALGVSSFALLAVWAGVPLARTFGALHPASPKLREAVARAIAKTGVPAEAVYELDLPLTNALALPLPRWLVFTRRCVEALSERELEAVACHELGHLSEPAAVKLARVGASLALLPLGFARAFIVGFGWPVGLGLLYGSILGVSLVTKALSRRMEARADSLAEGHEADAGVYARALERLHQANLAPAVGWSRGGSHPHLHDRMEAAGVVPAYPRPPPPSRMRAVLGSGAAVGALTLLVLAFSGRGALGPASEHSAAASVALFGGSADDFFRLAVDRDPAEAVPFLRASLALRPREHVALALLAEKLVAAERCDDASAARAEAERALESAHRDHARECPWLLRASAALAACAPAHGAARSFPEAARAARARAAQDLP